MINSIFLDIMFIVYKVKIRYTWVILADMMLIGRSFKIGNYIFRKLLIILLFFFLGGRVRSFGCECNVIDIMLVEYI